MSDEERLRQLEEAARQRGSDVDHSGRYTLDPDAERLERELVDDLAEGLTADEREQLAELEAKWRERMVDSCEVCGRPLAAGQTRVHGTCVPTCADCHRPSSYCSCSATVRRKRQAVRS